MNVTKRSTCHEALGALQNLPISRHELTEIAMPDTPSVPIISLPLRNLKLRPSMSVQVQKIRSPEVRQELQFLAAVTNKGVMIGPHGAGTPDHPAAKSASGLGLTAGEDVLVRGFTGQYDFSFSARVIQLFNEPFVYALVTYPDEVQAQQVRMALRMQTAWPAQVLAGGNAALDASVLDLSVAGAMVKTLEALGGINARVKLTLSAKVNGSRADLVLPARVCYSQHVSSGDGYQAGLQFLEVNQSDWLALHYLSTPA